LLWILVKEIHQTVHKHSVNNTKQFWLKLRIISARNYGGAAALFNFNSLLVYTLVEQHKAINP